MPLLTRKQRSRMLALGRLRRLGFPTDVHPVVKLYTPDAQAMWLLTELERDGDLAYGLCDLGLGYPELGQVRLSELAALRGPHGFAVAADTRFIARQPLSAYAEDSFRDGFINA